MGTWFQMKMNAMEEGQRGHLLLLPSWSTTAATADQPMSTTLDAIQPPPVSVDRQPSLDGHHPAIDHCCQPPPANTDSHHRRLATTSCRNYRWLTTAGQHLFQITFKPNTKNIFLNLIYISHNHKYFKYIEFFLYFTLYCFFAKPKNP